MNAGAVIGIVVVLLVLRSGFRRDRPRHSHAAGALSRETRKRDRSGRTPEIEVPPRRPVGGQLAAVAASARRTGEGCTGAPVPYVPDPRR
jgi:hypothetical protein